MGGCFSMFLPWMKRVRRRKARRARSARIESLQALTVSMEQRQREITAHSDTLTAKLKDSPRIESDVLESAEIVPLLDVSKASQTHEEKLKVVAPAGPGPAPPPPPLPSASSAVQELPHGLEQRQKIKVPKKLANPNWKNVHVRNMSKEAIWVKQADNQMSVHNDFLVDNLTTKFPQLSRSKSVPGPSGNKMDNQLCLKLTIFKNSTKNMDSQKIVNLILQCDKKVLTGDMLRQLKTLLPKDEAKKPILDESSESFLSPITDIHRLSERIDVLLFRLEHEESGNEYLERFSKNITTVRKACRELRESESLPIILKLILQVKNVMESSSDAPLSYGYDISCLTKLKDLKQENKQLSLLDFIVDTVSEKFPQCLNIQNEIPSIPDASCISLTEIKEWLDQHRCGLRKVDTEITEADISNNDDKLKEVLTPFAKKVDKDLAKLEGEMSTTKKDFERIQQYFTHTQEATEIDPCVEFFGYFKTFQEQYLLSIKNKGARKK